VEQANVTAHGIRVRAANVAAREFNAGPPPPNELTQRQLEAVKASLADRSDLTKLRDAVELLGVREILEPPPLQKSDSPLQEVFVQVNGEGEEVQRACFDDLSDSWKALFETVIQTHK
jgi:hypothetical protein